MNQVVCLLIKSALYKCLVRFLYPLNTVHLHAIISLPVEFNGEGNEKKIKGKLDFWNRFYITVHVSPIKGMALLYQRPALRAMPDYFFSMVIT